MMRMYLDIATVVSLFSVIFIFGIMYIQQLTNKHREEIRQEANNRNMDDMSRTMYMIEERLDRRIDETNTNIETAITSTRTRSVRN